ncbi:MAG: acyl-CoA thioester hydrolase [Oscillospiraceae bacterium]|nr:acyl-CoA thioester hydrolase [Oscillospiraceae bacterium]
MKKRVFTNIEHGINACWYPLEGSEKAMIVMLGDSADDMLVHAAVKWLHGLGCGVFAVSQNENDYGYHSYPLENFRKVTKYLKKKGCTKIGIMGISTTGSIALSAASYFSDITMTVAMSASDFVMEGFYRDGLDGAVERPGDNESTLSYKGEDLPYLPFAYRHPEYAKQLKAEAKRRGAMAAARDMFDLSEKLHPVTDRERIKVENIKGRLIFIGAEDDTLWDTCRYIGRMARLLDDTPHDSTYKVLTYEHGTHFVVPEGIFRNLIPVGTSFLPGLMFKEGRRHRRECLETRLDIDRVLTQEIQNW